MQQALIGVDIGTTSIKAVAFAPDSRALATVSVPTQTHYPRPDWAQYDPYEIWDAVCLVLRQLCQQLPADATPTAIAFTSMGEAAIPVDARGEPTHPAIAWFDRRTTPQADWWRAQIGADETARITGLNVRPLYGITKLMWLRENAPDAFQRTVRWLNMADYGAFRLCGVQATDYSLASRTMVLDLAHKRWSQQLLDTIHLPASLLATLTPSGVLLGRVHTAAAETTGLPEGLPVVSGGHDHVCGALALGITEPGDMFDSMGTAEGLLIALEQPQLDPEVVAQGIEQGAHVAPDRTYAMGGLYFAGGCIDWIRRTLLAAPVHADEDATYAELIELAEAAPPGSGGVFFLPHLRMANPPINDPRSRGAFVGLSSDTGPGHFARAVIEGVAYEYHQSFEATIAAFGLTPQRIIVTGGGARNRLLLQIKAALLGEPLLVPAVDEATCLGAAMLAGVGAGAYSGFADAAEQIQHVITRIEPDETLHGLYRERYRLIFQQLYPTLRAMNHRISERFVG